MLKSKRVRVMLTLNSACKLLSVKFETPIIPEAVLAPLSQFTPHFNLGV